MDVDVARRSPVMRAALAAHGGELIDRRLDGDAAAQAMVRARNLPRVPLSEMAFSDLQLIGDGAFSPLTGFMGQSDYQAVVEDWRLADGTPWSIPVVLPLDESLAREVSQQDAVALEWNGDIVGIIEVVDIFRRDVEREAVNVYGVADPAHPGVARIFGESSLLLCGPVHVFRSNAMPFSEHYLTPRQTRDIFNQRGWRLIVGFQTRNPIHRAHEHIQKSALETVDGLLLHPLVGQTKSDDVPASIRLRSYQTLIDHYYPQDRVLYSVYPAAMRYAGPREAIFHAIARKNFGCTHFIVGRDHAGVGNYYGTYDAQKAFDRFAPGELGITPLCFEHSFFCRRCNSMVSSKTCPHDSSDHVTLSGTRVRQMLRDGELLPPEISRPEVAQVLMEAFRGDGDGANSQGDQ